MNKRVLITGIAGSGGSYLAKYALQWEYEVYGISRWHSTTANNKNLEDIKEYIKIYECDLCDYSSIVNVLNAVEPDIIFHMASYANVRASFITPLSVIQNNIMGTANLLEATNQWKHGRTTRFILCSTSEVYGKVEEEDIPIKETQICKPANPYAVSKLTQDALGSVYADLGLDIVITRMFTYLNPRRQDLFATSFAKQLIEIEKGKRDILEHGNLESVRTIIDIRDAVNAYLFAAKYGKKGEVYNIGGEESISVGQFLKELIKHSNCTIETRLNEDLLRPVDVTLQIPDATKFKEHTGWKPRYSFEDTVKNFLYECRRIYS